MKRTDEAFVHDILTAAGSIRTYVHKVTKAEFLHNAEKRDAVIRQVGIIGEAASKLSATYRQEHDEVPWKEIIGMRNIVVHQYWEVDMDVLWDVAKHGAPDLLKLLRQR